NEKPISVTSVRLQQLAWMSSHDSSDWHFESKLESPVLRLFSDAALGENVSATEIRMYVDRLLEDVSAQNTICHQYIREAVSELSQVIEFWQLEDKSIESAKNLTGSFKRIFKGFNGFGTCYLCFQASE